MHVEIERKFLVEKSHWSPDVKGHLYRQSYMAVTDLAVVRVRIKDNSANIAIKSSGTSISHQEYEYDIPVAEGEKLMKLCPKQPLEKIRYKILWRDHIWDVDEFSGENSGLMIAEVELKSEDEAFESPPWIGKEVTGDERYYNAYLYHHPFKKWKIQSS